MSGPCEFTCTLTPEEEVHRRVDDVALAQRLQRVRGREPRRAVLVFSRDSEPLVRQFVANESRCCSFFTFAVHATEETAVLEIGAPAGAEHMLQALIDHFEQ